jgi:geranylgeranyl pyrophosphate synthase
MDIHDDIIDESIAKRNRKTIYGKLGKEAALLIGDVLMVKGFFYLHKAVENLQEERKSLIMDEVKDFLTEVVDAHISEFPLKAKKRKARPETHLQILKKKAVDIEGRMKVGAIYGGGSQREIDALSKYGRNIGILLAIRAEFVDMFEPDELTHRIKYECLPLPVLYALRSSKHRKRIQEILVRDPINEEDCNELIEVVYETGEISLLKQYLDNIKKENEQVLNILTISRTKNGLRLLTASLIEDL